MATTARWQRLDVDGDDACTLCRHRDGWRLEGRARFADPAGAADLDYRVHCDGGWRALDASVRGRCGGRRWDLHVDRDGRGGWRLDGRPVAGLRDCDDLDFGFTPATNMLTLRRLGLRVGDEAALDVVWIDLPEARLRRLPQRYRRLDPHRYAYESPTAAYAATLLVDDVGFARAYPRLWTMAGERRLAARPGRGENGGRRSEDPR